MIPCYICCIQIVSLAFSCLFGMMHFVLITIYGETDQISLLRYNFTSYFVLFLFEKKTWKWRIGNKMETDMKIFMREVTVRKYFQPGIKYELTNYSVVLMMPR